MIIINLIVSSRIIYLNVNNKYLIEEKIIEGLTAPRGRILDINGNILVDNKGVRVLIFNKINVSNKETIKIAKKLVNVIDIKNNVTNYELKKYYYELNKTEIDKMVSESLIKAYKERKISKIDFYNQKLSLITDEMINSINPKEATIYYLLNNGYNYMDKIIKTNLTLEEYYKINQLHINGLRTDISWERFYPYKDLLRDVFGSVSSISQGIPYELKNHYLNKGYNLNDRVGINNLEYIYDDYLKGEKAKYQIINGKLIKIKDEEKGNDLVLSIDIELQQKLEKILEEEMTKAKKEYNTKYYDTSYMVVSNPNTGEIISLIGKRLDNDKFLDYSYFNALSSFTIGSAVKGASISVGYKYGIIDEKTKVKDGCVRLYNQKPKCSWKQLGSLNDISALKMSSNYFQYLIAIGVTGNKYKAGVKIGATEDDFKKYRDIFASYGLGVKTGVDLSNESTGQKGITISDDLLLNMAIGQYDTYTPLELSQYINTIATGERKKLSLLKYIIDNDGQIIYENDGVVYNEAPIDNKYLNRIREGFKAVNKSGTGYSYTNHKFTSAGKTGTAESFLDSDGDGSIDTKTVSTSYIMYAPFDEPKFSMIIVSPHIKYKNKVSDYKYPINAKVIKRASALVYDYLSN